MDKTEKPLFGFFRYALFGFFWYDQGDDHEKALGFLIRGRYTQAVIISPLLLMPVAARNRIRQTAMAGMDGGDPLDRKGMSRKKARSFAV